MISIATRLFLLLGILATPRRSALCMNIGMNLSRSLADGANLDPECDKIVVSRAANSTAVEGSGVLTLTTVDSGSYIGSTFGKTGECIVAGEIHPSSGDNAIAMEIGTSPRTRSTANSTDTSIIIFQIYRGVSELEEPEITLYIFGIIGGGFSVLGQTTVADDGSLRKIFIERTGTDFRITIKNVDTMATELFTTVSIASIDNGAADFYTGGGYADAAVGGANTGTLTKLSRWA